MTAKKKKKKAAPKAGSKPARKTAPKTKPARKAAPKPKPARKAAPKPKPARKTAPKAKPARKTAPKAKPARKTAPKAKPARKTAPKAKPARKDSPKKATPTTAQRAALALAKKRAALAKKRAALALAKKRSKASAKGWLTRKSKAILAPLLGRLLTAREVASALPNDTNEKRAAWQREHRLHAEWYAQKSAIRDVLAQAQYESVVESVCRDFDIDDYTPFVES